MERSQYTLACIGAVIAWLLGEEASLWFWPLGRGTSGGAGDEPEWVRLVDMGRQRTRYQGRQSDGTAWDEAGPDARLG